MRLITAEDFKDIYIKFHQRGLPFLMSKFNTNAFSRTQSAFNDSGLVTSNFWIIPAVKERWNYLITGDPKTTYEEFTTKNYFPGNKKLKVLSLGSGMSSHEISFAELNSNWEIHCYDFSDQLMQSAAKIARTKNLNNIFFNAENVITQKFPDSHFDIVFFHASLHHFDQINDLLKSKILPTLKAGGHLIINEFVGANRLQYSDEQIKAINKGINLIPKKYRQIFRTNIYKNSYSGSGTLRMILSDPSECVDSEAILPSVHQYFETVIERFYGNNLLQSVFKDISHHFVELDDEKKEILRKVFKLEDEFLANHPSDFVFGIYKAKV